MKLVRAKVGPFKSINSPQDVAIDDRVTVLVGMNEAGKTIFLQALEKSEDALQVTEFDPVDDYPRKDLSAYLKRHKDDAELVTSLTYRLEDSEVTEINAELGTRVQKGFEFSVNHFYSNTTTITISVEEKPIIQSLLGRLSAGSKAKIKGADSLRQIPEKLKGASLTDEDKAFLEEINSRISQTKWQNVVASEAWTWLSQRLPKFLYFSDYDMLPSKINLTDLAQRVEQRRPEVTSR